MSLFFRVELSAPQMELLRSFQTYTDSSVEKRKEYWAGKGFSHFVVHVRPLLRESLVTCDESVPMFDRWRITEKGRLVLKIIDIDLYESATGENTRRTELERTAWRQPRLHRTAATGLKDSAKGSKGRQR